MESLRRGSALTLATNALRASLGPGSSGSRCSMAANTARASSARSYSLAQATTVSMVAPGWLAAAYSSGPRRLLASVSQNSAVGDLPAARAPTTGLSEHHDQSAHPFLLFKWPPARAP